MEFRAAVDAGDVVIAMDGGTVEDVSRRRDRRQERTGTLHTYKLLKYRRSNQGTCQNQKPIVEAGDKVVKGQVIADGPSTEAGEVALGKNLVVAYMPWEGHNYEDAIVLSERLVKAGRPHLDRIEEHEVDARDTKLGAEEIARDIPNVSEEIARRTSTSAGSSHRRGGHHRRLPGRQGHAQRVRPSSRRKSACCARSSVKAREVRDTSLKVPHGESGKVIGVRVFSRDDGDELPPGVNQLVRVYVAQKRKISDGDKLAGRHGNKGVISTILARGGHAVPGGRHAGRHHPEPARRPVPDEPGTGPRGAPGLRGHGRVQEGRRSTTGPGRTWPRRCSTAPREDEILDGHPQLARATPTASS